LKQKRSFPVVSRHTREIFRLAGLYSSWGQETPQQWAGRCIIISMMIIINH